MLYFQMYHILSYLRCTARPDDLDGESTRRTREHSDTIVEELELGVLWDEYGLVGDIVVRFFVPFPFPFFVLLQCPVDSLLGDKHMQLQSPITPQNIRSCQVSFAEHAHVCITRFTHSIK